MGWYAYFDPLYWAFILPPLALMIAAQIMVKSAYSSYSKETTVMGWTGAQVAQKILEHYGIRQVRIECISGKLTDHFDPRANVIRLSDEVYHGRSIAAIGIAAHETGHALQYADNYAPIRVRQSILPLARFGPTIGILLAVLGAVLANQPLVWIGLLLFSMVFLFQLFTLPVEFNASRRAIAEIAGSGCLTGEELAGAKRVLRAAALTYVAAALQSFMTLLYYVIRFTGDRRR